MKTRSLPGSRYGWHAFLAFTAISGFASSAHSQTPDSAAGQQSASIHALEQQIQNLYANASKAVVRIDEGDARGICMSGVIVSSEGYVLTRGMFWQKSPKVHLNDGRTVSAKQLGWSSEWQISVLKIVDEGVWPHVEFGSTKNARVGQPCVVIGYPTRGDTKYDRAPSIGYGAIEHLDVAKLFTTTCVVSHFEYPPVFSLDGKLLGIAVHGIGSREYAVAADVVTENWHDLLAGKNLDWIRFPPHKDSTFRAAVAADERRSPEDATAPATETRQSATDLAAAQQIAHNTTVRLVSKSRLFLGAPDRWSGVIVSADGYILTCAHSEHLPGEQFTVRLSDGRDFNAVALGTNYLCDVGLLKITDSGTWPYAKIGDSSLLAVGDPLVVCGYPAMLSRREPSNDRNPVVSDVAVTRRSPHSLWTYCLLFTPPRGTQGGMSGGGVFDSQGHYVGVFQGWEATRSEVVKAQWEHLAQVKPFPAPGERPHAVIQKALAPQAERIAASVVEIVVGSEQVALGTIVRSDGWIITKASVLTAEAKCKLPDGTLLSAKSPHVVHEHDLAFFKVDADNLPVATFPAADHIKAGALVAAVLPGQLPPCGVVSVETRAVPAEETWTGDGLTDTPRGVEVAETYPFHNGEVAQRRGDILQEINGHPIPDVASLKRLLGQELQDSIPGDLIELKVTRAGRELTLKTPLLPSDGYLNRMMDTSYTLRRSGFAAVFDADIPLQKSLCGGPVIDAAGQTVGIVIASRGRDAEERGPTMVLPASVVQAATERFFASHQGAN